MQTNWDDLRYFLAVSRTKSFLAAAQSLKVTHSTVARRLTNLEESLQSQLFFRTEKGCHLTPAGEELLVYGEQVESSVVTLEGKIGGHDSHLRGAVRIGAPDGIGNSYLASCLGDLQRSQSELEVELVAVPMYSSLAKREVDILVTVEKPASRGSVITLRLTQYRLGLFSTQDYLQRYPPIQSKADITKHSIIGYIDDLLFDPELQFMDEIAKGLKPRFRSSTVVAQLNAVASGAGIGVIPFFMIPENHDLVRILPEWSVTRDYWLQVNPDTRRLARVRTTIDFLVDRIKRDETLFLAPPQVRSYIS